MSPDTTPVGLFTVTDADVLIAVVALPLCAICAHELKLNKPMHVIKNDFVKKEMDPFENRLKIVEELFDEKNVLV